jgi:hypothetical protein
MNKIYCSKLFAIILLLIIPLISNSQELNVKVFQKLENNTSARIYKETDINGQNCAIIIIKHNFRNYLVETGKDYEKLEEKVGETWVWVSPDEYRLVIRKQGYIPLEFDLKNKLSSLETYELVVTDGYGFIEVNAPNSSIYIDEKYAGRDRYSFKLKDGNYSIKVTQEKHYSEQKLVTVHPGEKHMENFQLKPIQGELIIKSKPSLNMGSQLYINNEQKQIRDGDKIPLLIGNYNIRVEKDGYLPYKNPITITENQKKNLNIKLEIDPTISMNKYKKVRNIWLASTIASAGIGFYAISKSNSLYDEYQNATTDAGDIRNKIETYDKIKPIAFIASAACLVPFFIYKSKYKKAKQKLSLHASYYGDGGSILLTYKF